MAKQTLLNLSEGRHSQTFSGIPTQQSKEYIPEKIRLKIIDG